MEILVKEDFLEKYNISEEDFQTTNINWDDLKEIYTEYMEYRSSLFPTAETLANLLRELPEVHSVRTRVKDPEHLLDKIIRKTIREKKITPDYQITIHNYIEEITDLIGIRVLHLYKDQAVSIDQFIRDKWELLEACTIYYREGDQSYSQEETNDKFSFKIHPAGYRSWHYLISTNLTRIKQIAEVQVRTIFEEGWSEIDHQLRYPNDVDNILLTEQLLVLNRLAGSADEMINSIRETKINIEKTIHENNESKVIIAELKEQLEKVLQENEVNEEIRKELEEKVKRLEQSRTFSNNLFGESTITSNILVNENPQINLTGDNRFLISSGDQVTIRNNIFSSNSEKPYNTQKVLKDYINLTENK